MSTHNRLALLAMFAMALASPSSAAAAQPPSLAALGLLEHGEWELHERGNDVPRRVCISDGSQLLQLRHPGHQCRRFVIRNDSKQVSVAYDCAASGRGRTDVRIETSRLVQIDSQGISEGTPFVMAFEGRRVGNCKAAALAR